MQTMAGGLSLLVTLLSLLGGAALAVRCARSVVRTMLSAAEAAAAAGRAEVSGRRGDLTSLQEARAALGMVRSDRRRSAISALLWGLWLVVPLATDALPAAWAIAAPIWLLPQAPLRPVNNDTMDDSISASEVDDIEVQDRS